jgi:hypothetical protein
MKEAPSAPSGPQWQQWEVDTMKYGTWTPPAREVLVPGTTTSDGISVDAFKYGTGANPDREK